MCVIRALGFGRGNVTLAVVVRARDDGWPPLSTSATLHVVVVSTPATTFFDDDDDEVRRPHGHWVDDVWSESDSQAGGASSTHPKYRSAHSHDPAMFTSPPPGGSVAEWLACWTQARKGPGSHRSRDAVG